MDIQRISTLLHIEEKTRAHPTLKPIWEAVMKELHEEANPIQEVPQQYREPDEAEPESAPIVRRP